MGIDVVDIDRFARQLERTPALVRRLFVESERDLPVSSLAARFAAKEALAKSLAAPSGLSWQDAWVERIADRRPMLRVTGSVRDRAERLGADVFHLSLSHDAGIASAVVIAETSDQHD
ncbi:holo-[acyl-carrier protein] synthase [Spelaeicoccus albus]|uniref:Holo-[acyl-carrier-protein] synthase n=1 Tax=Spelaeicoccus albus TaxID=1280376 RepID=A0A7Z0A925_9MICO|nr:holo-[acyl-carrier protein] synthase [Spelaeicoccus albus]